MRDALRLVSIPNRVLAYLAVASLALLALAFLLDEQLLHLWQDHPLFSGVLAGVFTIPVSLILAAFLVEYAVAADREKRWRHIQETRQAVVHETSALVSVQLSQALLGKQSGLPDDTDPAAVANALPSALTPLPEGRTGVSAASSHEAGVGALLRSARFATRVVQALEALQDTASDAELARSADRVRHAIDEIDVQFGAYRDPADRGAAWRSVRLNECARQLLVALASAQADVTRPEPYWARA